MGGFEQGFNMESQRLAHQQARKEELSDQELQTKVNDILTTKDSIQAKLPSLQQGTPEYDQAISGLQQAAHDLRELYHPEKNPGRIEKFGHLVTDRLGLTSAERRAAKNQNNAAAGNQADSQSAQKWAAGAPLSAEQQYASQVNAKLAAIEKSPMSEENKERARQLVFGIPQRQNMKPWNVPGIGVQLFDNNDPDSIPAGATPYSNPTTGSTELAEFNKDIADGTFTGSFPEWQTKKKAAGKAPTNVEEQRESYRISHGIPSGKQLDWMQEQDFIKGLNLARNPYGGERLEIAREGLGLREREANVKDTMALQKQFTPLERIINTSNEADQDVTSPTGPGDVALTLAFFDAIKTQGVRFTKQEQDFIVNSRSFMDNAQAAFDKGFEGTVFGPPGSPQRAQIASIVKKAADIAKKQKQSLATGVGAFNPKAAAAATGTPDSGQTGGRPKGAIGTVPHNGKNYWVDAQGNNLGVAP